MIRYLLIGIIIFSLVFVGGCSEGEATFNNPYSGTCPHGEDYEDCSGECGNFVDTNADGLCDRSQ